MGEGAGILVIEGAASGARPASCHADPAFDVGAGMAARGQSRGAKVGAFEV
jgi:hypothetical protein